MGVAAGLGSFDVLRCVGVGRWALPVWPDVGRRLLWGPGLRVFPITGCSGAMRASTPPHDDRNEGGRADRAPYDDRVSQQVALLRLLDDAKPLQPSTDHAPDEDGTSQMVVLPSLLHEACSRGCIFDSSSL